MTSDLLKGKICISRPRGDGCGYIAVSVTDKASGVEFVEVRIKYADFALALGGSMKDCELRIRDLDLVGMRRERKTEIAFVCDGPYKEREQRAEKAIKAYEVDGWLGRVKDALNHHNLIEYQEGGATYRVSFTRWVQPKEEEK